MNYQTNIYCSTLAPVDWLNSCNTVCTKKFFCSTLWNWKPNVCTNTKYIQAVWRKIMATSRKMRLVRTDKHVTNNFLDWLQYNSICRFSEGKDCRYSKKFNSAIAVKPQQDADYVHVGHKLHDSGLSDLQMLRSALALARTKCCTRKLSFSTFAAPFVTSFLAPTFQQLRAAVCNIGQSGP